jgi:hypothetical protein
MERRMTPTSTRTPTQLTQRPPDHSRAGARRRRAAVSGVRPSAAWLAPATLAVCMLASGPASAAVLFSDGFDTNYGSLNGNDGWEAKYCDDPWTTQGVPGARPETDDGCGCNQAGSTTCEFAVFTQGGNACVKSEPIDNLIVNGDDAWTDYDFTVELRNGDNDTMGVVFRYTNTANYYALWLSRDTGPSLAGCDSSQEGTRLVRIAASPGQPGGVATLLAQSPKTHKANQTHLLRVRAAGDTLTVWFDDNADGVLDLDSEELFSVVDGVHPNGKIGLFAYQNGGFNDLWFDNVLVETLPPVVVDSDGDGLEDGADNCPLVPNADQLNKDGDALGDACDPDADGDGIDNETEIAAKLNPLDADSDEDGIPDGEEASIDADPDGDGLGAARDPDADGDGVQDGTEAGLTAPHPDTDVSIGAFIPDADPTTVTDPLVADTDGDGRDDGDEDVNFNGKVDDCESDPLVIDEPPCAAADDAATPDAGSTADASDTEGGAGEDVATAGDGGGGGADVTAGLDGAAADGATPDDDAVAAADGAMATGDGATSGEGVSGGDNPDGPVAFDKLGGESGGGCSLSRPGRSGAAASVWLGLLALLGGLVYRARRPSRRLG